MVVEERKPLSVVSKLCYGLGGMAVEVFWTVLGAYTNIFLVEVALLPPLSGTTVIFCGRIIDAFCNFIIGPMIDRTNTRWGKMKPWILGSGFLLLPPYILIWYVPDVGMTGKLAWFICLYIVLMFAKTALSISTRTYVMFLSTDSQERDSATVYRSLFMLAAIIAGVAMHGQIIALYGQAQIDPCANSSVTNSTNSTLEHAYLAEVKTGYLVSAGVISGITAACVIGVVIGTTERRDILRTSRQKRDQSLIKKAKAAMTFRPLVFLLLILSSVMLSLFIFLGSAVLYVQHALDLSGQVQYALLAYVVCAAVSMPIIGKLATRFGKRIPFICYQLAAIPPALGLQFIPERSLAPLLVVCAFLGFTGASTFFFPWAMLPDVSDDYNLQTGRRLDTIFFSVALSLNSLVATLGLGLTTITLEIGGYKTGACVQPASVGRALRILLAAFPSVLSVIAVVLMWKYPVTEERRREIKEQLENRKTLDEEDLITDEGMQQETSGDNNGSVYADVTSTSATSSYLPTSTDEEETRLPPAPVALHVECRETAL